MELSRRQHVHLWFLVFLKLILLKSLCIIYLSPKNSKKNKIASILEARKPVYLH